MGCAGAIHERYRRLVTDGAVRSNPVIVSTPFLHFLPGVVKAHEPVSVQTFGPELAVERLDEGVVGRLAGPGEVERHAFRVGPQVEIAGDELGALIDTDRARIAVLPAYLAFLRGNQVTLNITSLP